MELYHPCLSHFTREWENFISLERGGHEQRCCCVGVFLGRWFTLNERSSEKMNEYQNGLKITRLTLKIIIHFIYIVFFKLLKDTLHVTFTHTAATGSNSG